MRDCEKAVARQGACEMIQLQKYDGAFEPTIIDYIIAFFGFHIALNGKTGTPV